MKKKNRLEKVRIDFELYGYTVLDINQYKNNKSKLNVLCKNNHERYMSYNHFSKTKKCPMCNEHKVKYTYEEVKKIFTDGGCRLLSESYTSNREPLKYKCSCGNVSKIRLSDFRRGIRCRKCSGSEKYSYEEVKKIFSDKNCILLSPKYTDNKTPLSYMCMAGHITEISLSNFLRDVGCMKCYRYNNRGENHPFWNPDITDKERINKRKFNEYKVWRKKVFERDNYTCQVCGDNKGGNLNAHHLDGYDWCIDKRIDVDNGITLCETCHNDFHHLYGYGGNTKGQFEDYVNELLSSVIVNKINIDQ